MLALDHASATWRGQTPPTALLIDLDSLFVPGPDLAATLRAVCAAAAPYRWAVAAGHPIASLDAQQECRDLGIVVLPTRDKPNAADEVLMKAATDLRRGGIARAYLCTHDGDLAALPLPYDLLLTGRCAASRRLQQRARQVHVINPVPEVSARCRAKRE